MYNQFWIKSILEPTRFFRDILTLHLDRIKVEDMIEARKRWSDKKRKVSEQNSK